MREIKLRFWNIDKWAHLTIGQQQSDIQIAVYSRACINGSKFYEYTGEKDKNGVQIYEGDVIQYKSYHVNKRWWSNIEEIDIIKKECEKQRKDIQTVKNVVTFDKGGFTLNYPINFSHVHYGERFVKGQTHSCDTEEKQWDFEVIGNIHQNPKLLK